MERREPEGRGLGCETQEEGTDIGRGSCWAASGGREVLPNDPAERHSWNVGALCKTTARPGYPAGQSGGQANGMSTERAQSSGSRVLMPLGLLLTLCL